MANTTARDIARKLGISTASVSVALNGKPGVSQATRERVLAAAAELGYAVPKASAPGGKLICFLIYSDPSLGVVMGTNFYTFVLRGVESAATALGYRTLIRYFYAGRPFEDQLGDILPELAGLLVLATELRPGADLGVLPAALPCPLVFIDNFTYAFHVDSVGNDNLYSAKAAISYLLDCGHRRIGYLRVRQRINSFDDREEGIRMALRERLGEGAAPEIIPVDVSADGAFQDISAWLRTGPSLPDALFAENDFIAASAIRALTAHDIRVPEDISVMGFDDVSICEMVDPPITTVHSFKERLGAEAMTLLHRSILEGCPSAETHGAVRLSLSTRIVQRGSVAKK